VPIPRAMRVNKLLMVTALICVPLAACDKQKDAGSQATSASEAGGTAVPTAGIDRSQAGKAGPQLTFYDPDGEETSLADFAGKPLLVNLWATWCAPCVKELPTLAKLADDRKDLAVLALSQDMQPQPTVAAFLDEKKIALEPYQDPEMAMSSALGANILPTTILYGSDGKEIWRYTGDLDWTGEQAAELLKEAR
jgi:thiol-disulfide isomerase/thioredoxin